MIMKFLDPLCAQFYNILWIKFLSPVSQL